MWLLATLTQVFLYSTLSILVAQTPQNSAPASKPPRVHIDQEQLCCFGMHFVAPIYPREARLAHTEGVVKVIMVIAADNSIVELQPVSGDPLLLDSTMKALRQWSFSSTLGRAAGDLTEIEVTLSFTFKIQDPPKPAYLHLTNGEVIRADKVWEYTDRIEYAASGRTHHISPDSIKDVNACARVVAYISQKQEDCIPSGGPNFTIRAIPLVSAVKTEIPIATPLPKYAKQ